MTSLERVRKALNHEKTDRVPRLLYDEVIGYVPEVDEMLRAECSPLGPCEYFDMDVTGVVPGPTRLSRERFREWLPPGAFGETSALQGNEASSAARPVALGGTGSAVDEWGVFFRPGSYHHFFHIESPLRELSDPLRIGEYPWPDLDRDYRFEGMAKQVAELHGRGIAVAAFAGSIFEQAWYIRGMETLLEDMMIRPDIAHQLLDRTAHFQRCAAAAMAKAGVDIVVLGDDVASQTGLIMSGKTWATFLRDRLFETVRAAKEATAAARVFYHSDGNVTALIPQLIEAGIDILNPVQPECMDPALVKRMYGDRLCFFGTVSVQKTMPFGTPNEVRAEVRERVRTVGRDGGLILSPAHVLEPEVPWENIVAFFEAANEPM